MPSTLEKVMVRHVGWQRGHPRPLQRSVGKVFILLLLTFYLLAVSCYEKDSTMHKISKTKLVAMVATVHVSCILVLTLAVSCYEKDSNNVEP